MTVRDAVKKSGTPIALSGSSVNAADKHLAAGEKVLHAVVANCTLPDSAKLSGCLVVTTHRVFFCNSTLGNEKFIHFLFGHCIGIGDITGKTILKMPITVDGSQIVVELANRAQLAELQTSLLNAIETYPNRSPIDFEKVPDSHMDCDRPSSSHPSQNDIIKICRSCGDRLLAEAKKCPSCGSKSLAAIERNDKDGIARIRAMATSPRSEIRKPAAGNIRSKVEGVVCCPKCGSTTLSANKKGYGVGKAAAGVFFAGPVGAIAGGIGANKIEITCLNCGNKFNPGKK